MKLSIEERFWSKVDRTPGCWNWIAGMDWGGYGAFSMKGKNIGAHRFSWMLHNGDIKNGLFVCHKCDNPKCVNPDHLFLGTALDNAFDMVKKGRALINIKARKALKKI